MENKEQQQQDYLSKFVNSNDEVDDFSKKITPVKNNNNTSTLDYLNVDIDVLPLGLFYQPGIQIKIRSAKVHEIQSYSVVDDRNVIDVTEKMNQLLSSCVKVIFENGTVGSYKDIRDGDRIFLTFMIRELTFQKGHSLAKDVTCDKCNAEFKIPFRATSNSEHVKTFVKYDIPKELEQFFNRELRCFEFNLNSVNYRLAPPTIGIQEIFYDNIKSKVANKKNPNVAFLKIIPYLLWDRSSITDEGIVAKEDEFKKMDMYTFQVLNQAVNKMLFGLKGLIKKCPECSSEVYTNMSFPEGASSLFVIPDFFNDLIKK